MRVLSSTKTVLYFTLKEIGKILNVNMDNNHRENTFFMVCTILSTIVPQISENKSHRTDKLRHGISNI